MRWSCTLLALALSVSCTDTDAAPESVADGSPVTAQEAGPPGVQDSATPDASAAAAQDAGPMFALDASALDASALDASALDASADARLDALPDAPPPADAQPADAAPDAPVSVEAPSVQQVAAILELRCGGGCHQHQGSDGFVFDGKLRPALLAAVEVPASPLGDPPGAAACRMQRRVTPGDPANSYLLRKLELGLGRSPTPPVCGMGMPFGGIVDNAALALDYERLKLWIAGGAPLQ